MKRESVVKTVAAALGFFLIYAVISNLVSLGIQLCYFIAYHDMRKSDYDAFARLVASAMQSNAMIIGLVQLLLFLVIMFIIFKARGDNPFTRVRWNPVPKSTYVLCGAFAVSGIIALNLLFDLLMPQTWMQSASEYGVAYTSGGVFLNLLLVLVVGPLGEEVLMRGLITGRLMGRLPLWFVVAFPSILFGVGHAAGGVGQVVGTALTGLVFTLIFVWTNSLRTAVLAHALNNLFAAFLPWKAIVAGLSTPVIAVAGVVWLGITLSFAYLLCKRRDKNIAIA